MGVGYRKGGSMACACANRSVGAPLVCRSVLLRNFYGDSRNEWAVIARAVLRPSSSVKRLVNYAKGALNYL